MDDLFPVAFAAAVIKLKRAAGADEGVALTAADVRVLIEALKLLRSA